MQNRNKNTDADKILEDFLNRLFDAPPREDISIKSKEYHITITNNRTGEKIVDDDTNCICGGYAKNDEQSATIGFSRCNVIELVGAVSSAKKAINKMTDDNIIAKLLLETGD